MLVEYYTLQNNKKLDISKTLSQQQFAFKILLMVILRLLYAK